MMFERRAAMATLLANRPKNLFVVPGLGVAAAMVAWISGVVSAEDAWAAESPLPLPPPHPAKPATSNVAPKSCLKAYCIFVSS